MSGIFGFCGAPDIDVRPVVARMGETLRHFAYHRTVETVVAPGIAVGVHGATTRCPPAGCVTSPDGQVALWLVGCVLNAESLRTHLGLPSGPEPGTSDAALALAAYQAHGAEGLTGLTGEFLVAVWDGRTRELLLVNDRFGLYPHYYCAGRNGLAFAPELKALQAAPGFVSRLDYTAVAEFVRFQHLLGDRTWLEGASVLPYASVLRYRPDSGSLAVSRYWDWDRIPRLQLSFADAVDLAAGVVVAAVISRAGEQERPGVFLSGGLDARILAGVLSRRRPVDTLTFGHPDCRDVVFAARIARAAGTRHHVHPLPDGRWVLEWMPKHLALTEGFHSWIHMHGISMLEEARTRIDVNLTGWDGGTTLRGRIVEYGEDAPFRHFARDEDLERLLFDASCRRFTWPGLTDAEADALTASTMPGLPELALESFVGHVRRTARFDRDRRADYFYAQHHLRRSTACMVVMTRAAVEVRCPYFDYDLVDLGYGLPDDVRASPTFVRAIIAKLTPRLARIPYEADLRLPHPNPSLRWAQALPGRVAGRLRRFGVPIGRDRSRLYADYEDYLRNEVREWAAGLLFDARTVERGLFDRSAVRSLWARHLVGRESWTMGKVVPLMTIEQVCRYLLDGDSAASAALGPAGERR